MVWKNVRREDAVAAIKTQDGLRAGLEDGSWFWFEVEDYDSHFRRAKSIKAVRDCSDSESIKLQGLMSAGLIDCIPCVSGSSVFVLATI